MISVSTDKLLKRCYVGASHSLRGLVGPRLDAPSRRVVRSDRFRIWLHSLFAIHDIDEMSRLDLAWWQLDALAEVDRFLRGRPDARVFEYGSGASTLWLARRAGEVVSVEHDENWHSVLAQRLDSHPNVRLRLFPGTATGGADDGYGSEKSGARGLSFQSYVHAIDEESEAFDLVVIDGRCRVRCLEAATGRLKPDGIILFDNSNRWRYRRGIAASKLHGRRYRGLTACLPYPDETTLLRASP